MGLNGEGASTKLNILFYLLYLFFSFSLSLELRHQSQSVPLAFPAIVTNLLVSEHSDPGQKVRDFTEYLSE